MKKELYQHKFRIPAYFWFSPESLEFARFRLIGNRYQEIVPTSRGQLWSEVLNLYLGIDAGKLRYFAPDGTLIPTLEEVAEQERWQKEIAQQQVQQPRERL